MQASNPFAAVPIARPARRRQATHCLTAATPSLDATAAIRASGSDTPGAVPAKRDAVAAELAPAPATSSLAVVAWALPGAALFALMIIAPTSFVLVKTLLLAWCLTVVMLTRWSEGCAIRGETFAVSVFMVLVGTVLGVHGMLNGTPGWSESMRVFVMWPIAFSLLVGGLNQVTTCRSLLRVLWAATVVVGLHNLSFVLVQRGVLPSWAYIEIGNIATSGFYDGYVQVNTLSINGLAFLAPFLVAAVLYWPSVSDPPIKRHWMLLSLALLCAVGLLSGRRGIWLATLAALPVIALLGVAAFGRGFHQLIRWRNVLAAATSVVVLGVAYQLLSSEVSLSVEALQERLESAADFENDPSNQIRVEQFEALIDGWKDHPLVGAGLGAAVWGHQRDREMPWAFELFYVALLYHAGMLGFLCYVAGVGWIFYRAIQAIRWDSQLAPLLLPVMVGTTCFLLANASNPYLAKFDYMWVLFLPITMIDTYLWRRAGGLTTAP